MISRRGMLGGLLAGLAAPAIIRTPGLLMPIRPVLDDFTTDNLLVVGYERYSVTWSDWRGAFGAVPMMEPTWPARLRRVLMPGLKNWKGVYPTISDDV